HCNFPHHRDGVLRVLGCDGTREAVTVAVAGWKAAELEDALAAAGLCAGMVRAPDEWQRDPQAQAVAELPLFEIVQIGEAPAAVADPLVRRHLPVLSSGRARRARLIRRGAGAAPAGHRLRHLERLQPRRTLARASRVRQPGPVGEWRRSRGRGRSGPGWAETP